MTAELDEYDREPPMYYDSSNPKLQSVATAALRKALVDAAESAVDPSDLWGVFNAFVTRYQYGQFMDSLVDSIRSELRSAIAASESSGLRQEAMEGLRAELRRENEDALLEELRVNLVEELRPSITKAVRASLLQDPGFIADAKAELQRKMLGL